MSLRRILAELIDPDIRATEDLLRQKVAEAVVSRGVADIRLVEAKVQLVAERAVLEALLAEAREDVARLLEDAARCAAENHTTPPEK